MTQHTGSRLQADNEAIFLIHVPKTAGSTLRIVVRRQYAEDECFLTYPPREPGRTLASHPQPEQLRLVMGHYRYGFHRDRPGLPYRYAAFLREPFSQVRSHYYYLRTAPKRKHAERDRHRSIIEQYPTLADFAGHEWAYNLQTVYLSGIPYVLLKDAPEEALSQAIRNLDTEFVAVGLTERFDESLVVLQYHLGWRDVSYVKTNVRTQRFADEDDTDQAREAIDGVTRLDQVLYDHAQAMLDRQISQIPDFESRLEILREKNAAKAAAAAAAEQATGGSSTSTAASVSGP
ncbi:MAG: hypothetical protein D8M59_10085 [Planctomycetes bacterium]|nr:hypothetical protein [Planctomycetota bacterium]NOG53393.1 hypothetical protein [Planctomycetota bacterium]